MIVNHLNNVKATTQTDTSIDNIFNPNGTINTTAVVDLLEAVGFFDNRNDTGTYKAHQIRTRNSSSSYNGDATIIFPMGYYNGTDIYWQATYLYNNYLTIWMVKNYTNSDWDESFVAVNYTAYANSTIQNYLDNTLWSALTMGSGTLQSIFALPSNVGYQSTSTANTTYWYRTNSSEKSTYNNLASAVANNSYLWLPSAGETMNNQNASWTNNTTSYTGQWGLNSTDRSFDGTSTSDCWLRSGLSSLNSNAMLVNSSGSTSNDRVDFSHGVRPAAHISLSSLASVAGSEIFASVASDAIDRAQVSPSYQYYVRDSGAEMTVTYTANTGYYISQITVNNLDLPISASVASAATFVNAGSYSYRCYRSDNQVIIILTNITANLNIIGIVIPTPVTVNIDGSANYGAHSVNIDFDAATGNATVSVNLSGRYPYSVALGSNSPQLINRWNDTVYQTSDAFAVTYQTNNYSTKIKFYVVEIDGQIVINLVTTNVQPPLEQGGGTSISGVALQVSASGGSTDLAAVGEARITGYNQTEGLTTVHVSAVASRGYAFVGWQVDGKTISTLLSADIPYDDVEGKILVAVFEPINQNINDETDNNQTSDIV